MSDSRPFLDALASNGPQWTGRRPCGVPLIIVMSAAEARRMRPRSAHGVIVALRDLGAPPVAVSARWEAVLRLEFADISRDGNTDPTSECLAAQASLIVEFVHAHQRAPLIAFHCHDGISRSRTVAAVVCEHYRWPYYWSPMHGALEEALRAAFTRLDATRGVLAPLEAGETLRDGRDAPSHLTAAVAPSLQEMFEASLLAFWALAERFGLTMPEQARLLALPADTCRRWRRDTPPMNVDALERLQVVLRTYEVLTALAPVSWREMGRLVRAPGSAESPDEPSLSLLEALSVPSIREMRAHCLRLESRRHAV